MLESLFNKFADIKSEILLDERLHHEYFSMKKFYLENTFLSWKHLFNSSRPEVFSEKGVLRNFAKIIGKHLCHRVFF